MSSKRALVTGATGFSGSDVADAYLHLEMEVVATEDASGGFRENFSASRPRTRCFGSATPYSEWVKQHSSREPVEFKGEIEVEGNLPPWWRTP